MSYYNNPYVQDDYGYYDGVYGVRCNRRSIVDYINFCLQASECVSADEFEVARTRHICKGTKQIILLDKEVVPVYTDRGIVNVEVFFCPRCRKLIINNSCFDLV